MSRHMEVPNAARPRAPRLDRTVRAILQISLAAAFAATAAVGANAHAEGSPEQDAGSVAGRESLEDVVVSARRREERSQDVPLAISVFDSDALDASNTFNIGGLQRLQPSIQFYSSNQRNTAVNIRGLGAPFGLTNDGIEQGVGIYIDQVYYARIAAATLDFLDVERVEVLRGPQGTLYGKNTTAGAVNVTSRRPSFTPEYRFEASGGNLDFRQFRASVSGPLVGDTVAARFGASYADRRGSVYDVVNGRYINDQNNLGAKLQVLARPTESLDLIFSADYSVQDPVGYGLVYVRTGSTQRPQARQYAALAAASNNYRPPSFDPFDRVTDLDATLRARNALSGASLLAEWKLGGGTLTSVTAWRSWDWKPANDRDFTGLPITTISQNPSQQSQWSQELRYSASHERVDYVVGLYGFRQKIDTQGVQEQGALASRWLLSGADANNPAILNGLRADNDIGLKNTSAAVFGQLSWKITDRWSMQPGVRFNYDKKDGRYVATVRNGTGTALTAAQLGVLAPQSYAPKFHDTNLSGDLNTSFAITPDVLAYATYARSFKSGGINLSGLPLDANNQPITAVETIEPERVNHFEVGLKTQLFGRAITANVAAFNTEISDYQATVTNSQANVIRGYLANAEKVRVRGLELELSARPTERVGAFLNATLTDHEYVKFPDAPCPPELAGGTAASAANPPSAPGTPGGFSPPFCNISGQWLPGVSRVVLTYGGEYSVPLQLFGQSGDVYLGVDGSYRSKFSSNPSRSAYTDGGAYALANARAGFRTTTGWDVSAWVRNAFDRNYFDFLSTQAGNTGLVIGQPGDPRTFGLTVRVSF
jgi:iron complex outermembrane receptor protein